jgi:antitoxin component of RelBE/YafQ-DinJ toxin-antitoxin module
MEELQQVNVRIDWDELKKFENICENAGVRPGDMLGRFIKQVNEEEPTSATELIKLTK